MNRRDFAKSLAAVGLVPALPALPAATAAAAAPAYTPYMFGLGAHMARTTGHCSSAMLAQKLGLSSGAANAMQAQLMRTGIITAPNAAGLAAAAQPYMSSASLAQSSLSGAAKFARRLVRKAAESDISKPENPSEDTDLQ